MQRAADGTEILTVAFPGGGPVNGNAGAPVVNGAGSVIGIAVWQAASAGFQDAVDVSGVAAASLGCVATLPSSARPVPSRPRCGPSSGGRPTRAAGPLRLRHLDDGLAEAGRFRLERAERRVNLVPGRTGA